MHLHNHKKIKKEQKNVYLELQMYLFHLILSYLVLSYPSQQNTQYETIDSNLIQIYCCNATMYADKILN